MVQDALSPREPVGFVLRRRPRKPSPKVGSFFVAYFGILCAVLIVLLAMGVLHRTSSGVFLLYVSGRSAEALAAIVGLECALDGDVDEAEFEDVHVV